MTPFFLLHLTGNSYHDRDKKNGDFDHDRDPQGTISPDLDSQ